MAQTNTSSSPPARWKRYVPTADRPWNLRRVVHLNRRAGFAATWNEIGRDLADGPEASITRVLAGKARSEGVPADFHHMAAVIGDAAVASSNVNRLKAWWLYRMLFTPDPLAERLALVWHNHFATSNAKVDDPAAMRRQNDIFRELGRAPFSDLLRRVVHDPALLNFLDAPANRKEHPNENLGRELMELFTVGVGHYGETDVKEAARALTGWTVTQNGQFREVAERHDEGEKTILGRTGPWRGDDLVAMLLEHPATARRVAYRLCEAFLGAEFAEQDGRETNRPPLPPLAKGGRNSRNPPIETRDLNGGREGRFAAELARRASAIDALAAGLREHNLDIGWAVETILRSELFFSDANIGTRVVGPVEHVVGAVRALEQFDPPPGTLVLAEWTARLGQDLFYPPNVFGWPGGRSWITSRSLIGRANFAAALVQGNLAGSTAPLDLLALLERHGRARNVEEAAAFCCDVFLGGLPSDALRAQVETVIGSGKENEADRARRVAAVILASPEMQTG
ncbi:MAG: DUF1800 domain-containing protein [Planctomycetaceae bacterium]